MTIPFAVCREIAARIWADPAYSAVPMNPALAVEVAVRLFQNAGGKTITVDIPVKKLGEAIGILERTVPDDPQLSAMRERWAEFNTPEAPTVELPIPWCCFMGCFQRAEYQIWGRSADDYTEACAKHLDELRAPGDTVVPIGESPEPPHVVELGGEGG